MICFSSIKNETENPLSPAYFGALTIFLLLVETEKLGEIHGNPIMIETARDHDSRAIQITASSLQEIQVQGRGHPTLSSKDDLWVIL
mmetsp:Transcript_60096/g.82330  ORF Transcript_60096/g.82330 Transcript_60096/m.82330 type:complete len:87 (+) Transcript_60096:515-775(+)